MSGNKDKRQFCAPDMENLAENAGGDALAASTSPKNGKGIIKRAIGIVTYVLLLAILACSIVLVLLAGLSRMRDNKSTGLFGLGLYQIISGSMVPEINVGDVIVCKKTDFEDLKVGQNIVFYDHARDMIITHKIIAVGSQTVTTHGVANPEGANETVAAADIIARQVLRLPKLGFVINFVRSPGGFVLIILLPIGGLIAYQSVSLARRLRQYRAENAAAEQSPETARLKSEIAALKERLSAQPKGDENGCVQDTAPQPPTESADAKALPQQDAAPHGKDGEGGAKH